MKPELTAEYARECLDYNPDTGIFTWKVRPRGHFRSEGKWKGCNTRFAGKEAGYLNETGYISLRINKTLNQAHRIAWLITTGSWPTRFIDHINMNRSDNRLANLREVTNGENMCNSGRCSRNTSGTKGISWHAGTGKWRAQINVLKKHYHIGLFQSMDDAAKAIKEARIKLHGEFAHHG